MPLRQLRIETRRRAGVTAVSIVVAVAWLSGLWLVFDAGKGDDGVFVGDVQPWASRLYVTDVGTQTEAVLIVDTRARSARIVQSIALGSDASIAVSADGSTLVAVADVCRAAACESVLSVVDTRWGNVTQRIALSWPRRSVDVAPADVAPAAPTLVPAVALSPDGRIAYAWADGAGSDVSIGSIDLERGTVSTTSAVPGPGCVPGDPLFPLMEPRTIAIVCARSNDVRFLSLGEDGSLLATDTVLLADDNVRGSIELGAEPAGVPVAATPSADLARLFVATSNGTVVTLDLRGREVEGAVDLGLPGDHIVAPGASLVFSPAGELAVAFRPEMNDVERDGVADGVGLEAVQADVVRIFDVETWQMLAQVSVEEPFDAMTRVPERNALLLLDRRRGVRILDPRAAHAAPLLAGIRRPGFAIVPLLAR